MCYKEFASACIGEGLEGDEGRPDLQSAHNYAAPINLGVPQPVSFVVHFRGASSLHFNKYLSTTVLPTLLTSIQRGASTPEPVTSSTIGPTLQLSYPQDP